MKDVLATLATGRVFTKLDLREAYYQVHIKAGDEWKTTFNFPLGSYQFQVMPFGLQGAPAVFMQLINEILHEHLYRGGPRIPGQHFDIYLDYGPTYPSGTPSVEEIVSS